MARKVSQKNEKTKNQHKSNLSPDPISTIIARS